MTKRKNKHAVALGKRGGKRARAKLTPAQASQLGRLGAIAMHAKRREDAVNRSDDYLP